MLSFFVYLVTAILCFYLGRREKNRQLQAVTRERDNWRLMFSKNTSPCVSINFSTWTQVSTMIKFSKNASNTRKN